MGCDSNKLNFLERGELILIELENGLCELGNYHGIVSCGKNLHIKLFPYAGVRNVLVDKYKLIEGIKSRRKTNCASETLDNFILNSFYPNLDFINEVKSGKEVEEKLREKGFSLDDYYNLFPRN